MCCMGKESAMDKIKDMYDCSEQNFEYAENLGEWFSQVVEKTSSDLTERDVARCISGDIFVEAATDAMMGYLLKNPLAGDTYDGEFIEMASFIDESILARHISSVRSIVDTAHEVLYDRTWESEDDRTAFRNSAVNLKMMLDEDTLMDILKGTDDPIARNQVAIYLGSVQCEKAAEPIIELIGNCEPEYSRGPLLYALEDMNISYGQLKRIIPYAAAGNFEERVSAVNLIRSSLGRLSDDEMKEVISLLGTFMDE